MSGHSLGKIQLRVDLLVLRPLRNKERISCSSLPYGRIETEDELDMKIVDFGKEEDTVNRSEGDSVISALPE